MVCHEGLSEQLRFVVVIGAALIVMASCVNGSSPDAGSANGDQPQDMATLDPPESLDVSAAEESGRPRLIVSFAPVQNADGYVADFDEADPVRIEPADCTAELCQMRLDQLTVGASTSVTVAAQAGSDTSPPSEPAELPPRPDPPQLESWPDDEPVPLVVVRVDEDGRPSAERVLVPPDEDVDARIAELEAEGDVESVGIDLPAVPQGASSQQAWQQQAGASDVDNSVVVADNQTSDAPSPDGLGLGAWQVEAMDFASLPGQPRGRDVTVAVIDGGVQRDHTTLVDADITTTNVANEGNDAPHPHGTAVTSMLAGQADDTPGIGQRPNGVPGIAPGVTVLAYDVLDDGMDIGIGAFKPSAAHTHDAFLRAVDDGADIISISMSWQCLSGEIFDSEYETACPDELLQPVINYAERSGVVVVTSAGNDGGTCGGSKSSADAWPAKFPTVLAVGGTISDGTRWECSPEKDYVDMLAPAHQLRIAEPTNTYGVASGTSFATPLVAGVAAVVLAAEPDLTPTEVRDLLTGATHPNGRLIPAAVMAELGLYEDPLIDPATAAEIWPFAAEISFAPGTGLQQLAVSTDELLEQKGDGFGFVAPYRPDLPFPLHLQGLLFVDEDGVITGQGHLRYVSWSGHDSPITHHVECRNGLDSHNEGVEFTWDIPVVVNGQVTEGRGNRSRNAELIISLGRGATADDYGALPGIQVLSDVFADCATEIQECERDPFCTPDRSWEEIKDWPDETVDRITGFYEYILANSPHHIEDVSFPPPRPEQVSTYRSSESHGNVTYSIQIGPPDMVQFLGRGGGR